MRIKFEFIIGLIKESKIKSVIRDGLSYNEDLFKKIKQNLPHNFKINGYSSVKSLPFNHHGKLADEIYRRKIFIYSPKVKLILQGWYLKNIQSTELVKSQLLSIGYKVNEPDFDNDYLDVESLKEVDIFTNEADCKYFRPGGHQIDGLSDDEATNAATFLGWSVLSTEELSEMKIDTQEELEEVEKSEVTDKELNKNSEIEKLSAEDLINRLELDFQNESQYFTRLSQDLLNGLIPESDVITQHIQDLREALKKNATLIIKGDATEVKSLPQLKELYQKEIEQNNELQNKAILLLFNQIYSLKHKKGHVLSCIEKLKDIARDFSSELDLPDRKLKEWYLQMTSENHYFNLLIKIIETRNRIEPDEELLDRLLTDLKTDLIKHQLDFYEELATQINRGNIFISSEPSPNPSIDNSEAEKSQPVENISLDLSTIVSSGPTSGENLTDTDGLPDNKLSSLEQTKIESSIQEAALASIKTSTETDTENVIDLTSTKEVTQEPVNNDLNLEDQHILQLLKIDEPELAFHLAKCYEAEHKELTLPSFLLQNLFLSRYIRTSTGPIAQEVEFNLSQYDYLIKTTENKGLINRLIFASILRPALFAFDSNGAIQILQEIYGSNVNEFSELIKHIIEFMDQNRGIFSFDRINKICGHTKSEEIKESYLSRISAWLDKAQTARSHKKISPYHTQVFYNWVKKDGWLNNVIAKFLNEQNGITLKNLLEGELQESSWKKKYQKDIKEICGKQKNALENITAFRWISQNIDSLKEILEEAHIYFTNANRESSQQEDNILINFVKKILKEIARVKELPYNSKEESLLGQVSQEYLLKAFENLEEVLSGTVSGLEQLSADKIVYSPLLKLPFYESDINWQSIKHNNLLAELILKYLDNPIEDWNEVALKHIRSGNIEALNRIISLNLVTESNFMDTETIDGFPDRLKFEIKQTKIEIERGCAFGYILNGRREKLLSALQSIENENNLASEGVNFPLRKMQIESILNEIHSEKLRLIDENISLITSDITDYRDYLNDLLNKGNLIVFNDTLERIKTGHFVFDEDKNELFKDFYKNFLAKETGKEVSQISEAIKKSKNFRSYNFSRITEFQAKEFGDAINKWRGLKRFNLKNNSEGFLNVKPFLEILGFVSSQYEKADTYGKAVYFDFSCNPIEGRSRTAIPQFGSVAKGKYRLITLRDAMTEEDQFEMYKELIPTTNRAVIVFNFFWMNQINRLELAKLSKKNRITFLVMDEAMLLYLFAQKESKFPAFIKLAAPFTFAEPYQTASSNLPVEMFYGRKPQIEKLRNIIGDFSCLIYGGRQLGKTVLQREVQRLFHQPEKNYYAIYIDLRESGIGLWKPIEATTAVLAENLCAIPDLIPEKVRENASINSLTAKIKEWLDNNKEARIILFLDESDKFLEQEALREWPNVLPLKGLMEKTDRRFKLVLAGLHDVRRTMKIPNNPLAHFGKPICIGPMLGKEEAIEAQRLITLPIETLGAEFESEDLVFMILSHCNWYPSLIQILCSKLLNVINEKRNIKELPIIITSRDVAEAYERSREHIKEKFNLTLSLDERYDLLANIIANNTILNPSLDLEGIGIEKITDDAIFYWPDGFDNTNTKLEIKLLLEEMVDLGILRIGHAGNVALRTPNLLGLIGDEKQISDNLLSKDRVLPSEFNREVSRIMYESGSRKVMSPFPAFYYDKLINPEIKVVLFRGSKMGGIDYVYDFLKNHKKETNLIIPKSADLFPANLDGLDELIEKKRVSTKHNVLLFNDEWQFTYEDIEAVRKKVDLRSKLTAVFLIRPENLWSLMLENEKVFERLENQKIEIFNIPQWREEVAKEWFRETGCITANIPEIFKNLSNWHKLIVEYHGSIVAAPELWQEKLVSMVENLKAEAKTNCLDFGLLNEDHISAMNELVDWDGSINRHEFIYENPSTKSPKEKENMLNYFHYLNLIDNSLRVNDLVKKILSYE